MAGCRKIYRITTMTVFVILFITVTSFSSPAQHQFTHAATRANNGCNYDCTLLDAPEINSNPSAIIWATPLLEKGVNLNPHPIGVYYFKNQWSILNLDQRPIPEGAKFNVECVAKPDATHFQYIITNENIRKDGAAFIDHPSLNNNPTAQFISFLSWIPEQQRGASNREETRVQFDVSAGRWYISNTNKKPLFARVTYNIIISNAGKINTTPVTTNLLQINELIIAPTAPSASGNIIEMYMTVWADGIKLPGDNVRTNYLDKTQIFDFEMGGLKPYPSGKIGKATFEPVTIKIHTGFPVTVPFFNAFVKNQGMIFTIEAFSSDMAGTGVNALNYTIKLSGANIVGFRQVYQEKSLHLGQEGQDKKYYDEIKIIFTKIEFIKDGTIVEANL